MGKQSTKKAISKRAEVIKLAPKPKQEATKPAPEPTPGIIDLRDGLERIMQGVESMCDNLASYDDPRVHELAGQGVLYVLDGMSTVRHVLSFMENQERRLADLERVRLPGLNFVQGLRAVR